MKDQQGPENVLKAIDDFAWHEQWMMNVGDVKGEILDSALQEAMRMKPEGDFRALELGGYLGYSAVRLARRLRGELYSVEKEEANVSVAVDVLKAAGLGNVTLLLATAAEETRRLKERRLQLDFVFIDHEKQDYLPALLRLEAAELLRPQAVVVADNVGLMEISDYANHVRSCGRYRSAFVESEVEYMDLEDPRHLTDGLEVSVYLGRPENDPARWAFKGARSVRGTTLLRG